MKNFRQKQFSKSKVLKKSLKYVKDHPILPVSTASLAVGLANYKTNTKRQKESVVQHEEQLKALKNLNENIVKNSEALSNVQIALKDHKVSLDTHRDSSPKTAPHKRTFLIFRKKDFSIQDGGFKGNKEEPKPSKIYKGALTGAAIGTGVGGILGASNTGVSASSVLIGSSILGAGLGALTVWLNNIAEKSVFNRGLARKANSYTLCKALEDYYTEPERVEEKVTMHNLGDGMKITNTTRTKKSSSINPQGTLFNMDADPKKHVVNLLLRGNVMVMLLNKPTQTELKKLNILLDSYCKSYRLADYTSEKLGKDMYLVEISIVNNTEGSLVINLIEAGFKVNILTTDRFGIKNI